MSKQTSSLYGTRNLLQSRRERTIFNPISLLRKYHESHLIIITHRKAILTFLMGGTILFGFDFANRIELQSGLLIRRFRCNLHVNCRKQNVNLSIQCNKIRGFLNSSALCWRIECLNDFNKHYLKYLKIKSIHISAQVPFWVVFHSSTVLSTEYIFIELILETCEWKTSER